MELPICQKLIEEYYQIIIHIEEKYYLLLEVAVALVDGNHQNLMQFEKVALVEDLQVETERQT